MRKSNKWTFEAIYEGEEIKVVSDGTKEGTVIYANDFTRRRIELALLAGEKVVPWDEGPVLKAGYDSQVGLLAGVYSLDPGQVFMLKVPRGVRKFVNSIFEQPEANEIRVY